MYPRSQGLGDRLLGREASGEFRYPPPTVVDFSLGVDAREKAIAKAL